MIHDDSALEDAATSGPSTGERKQKLDWVAPELIDPDPRQPRKSLGNLEELIASIKEHGIQSPLGVMPTP